jgi:hypothetical protein
MREDKFPAVQMVGAEEQALSGFESTWHSNRIGVPR